MLRPARWFALLLLLTTTTVAQQTIYWKKDHIYVNGKEVAIVTPAPSDQTAPTAPSSLAQSSVTATSVQLSWSASTDSGGSGLAGYKIYRQLGTGASLPVGSVGTATLSFTDQLLLPSTGYNYTLIAFDAAQNHSTASNTVAVTTTSSSGDATAPDAPLNLRGRGLTRQTTYKVRLDWNAATDAGGSGVSGYEVYRNDVLISGGSPITTLFYEDSTSTANTSFTYKIKSVDGMANKSGFSSAVAVTTLRELIESDDFNRADTSGVTFGVRSNTLEVLLPDEDEWDNHSVATGLNDFRATIQIINRTVYADSGFSFWYVSSSYRAYIDDSTLRLNYGTQSSQTQLASASGIPPGVGTLTVEATSSARRIKVYWNGVLKIDFTETDTSRSNSGSLRLTSYVSSLGVGRTSVFDNLLLER